MACPKSWACESHNADSDMHLKGYMRLIAQGKIHFLNEENNFDISDESSSNLSYNSAYQRMWFQRGRMAAYKFNIY
jgi:hypothetical protein